MSDTQWICYEVFKQDAPNKPHQAVGSVHAPDAEIAMLNARDLFVRRPKCVSLWVVPASDIFSRTQQELELQPLPTNQPISADQPSQIFYIFRKSSHRRAMTFVDHVGEVSAPTAEQALQQALGCFTDEVGLAWWVVPAAAIVASREEDIESLFAPALTKTYRHQSAYGFVGSRPPSRKSYTQIVDLLQNADDSL